MASREEGNREAIGFALIERASELCAQVEERLMVMGIRSPRPRHFALALLELNDDRTNAIGFPFPKPLASAAFGYLVPPEHR